MSEQTFRVLAITGSDDLHAELRAALDGTRYELVSADNGRTGLTLAWELVPDLILLDLGTLGVSGFEISRRLKAARSTRRVPITFLTGVVRPLTLLNGLGHWPVDFLSKPIDRQRVLELVERTRRSAASVERLKELGRELRAASAAASTSGPLARRRVHRQLAAQFERLYCDGVPAAQLRFQIGRFRHISKSAGPLDRRALEVKVAETIRGLTRVEDLVASDEAGGCHVLLAGVTPMGARMVGEKIRRAVEEKPFRIGDALVRIEVSIDVAHFSPPTPLLTEERSPAEESIAG